MTNRVEIIVSDKYVDEGGFSTFDAKLKGMETRSDSSVGRIKDKLKKGGTDAGEGYADNVGKGLTKGLAAAEAKLAAAKARMDKALALGAGDNTKRSIEYDIKLHEESVRKAKDDIDRHAKEMGKRLGDGVDSGSKGIFALIGNKISDGFERTGTVSAGRMVKGLGADIGGKVSSVFERIGQTAAGSLIKGTGTEVVGFFGKLGGEAGQFFSKGVGSGLTSILTSPPVLGLAAGLATILVPAIGAALASGVMLGLGGGVIAIGLMHALKAPAVTGALDSFKAKATDAFASFGRAFEGPTSRALATFGTMLDRLSPAFSRIGQAAAPLIDRLAPALATMAENAMPGIETAMSRMGPIFDALAGVLPELGTSIGAFFDIISSQGPGATQFIKDFVRFLGMVLENTARVVAALTWLYGKIRGVDDSSKDAGKSIGDMGNVLVKTGGKTQTLSERLAELTQKMLSAAQGTLGARAAARAYEDAVDALATAIKKGAHGLDIHTASGRKNQAMLDDIASKAIGAAQAARTNGAANAAVQAIIQRGAGEYLRQAQALGMNRRAAVDLTAAIFGIPATRKTLVDLQNAARSRAEASSYAAELNRIPRNIYTLIQVDRRESVGPDGHRIGGFAHGGITGSAASGGIRNGMTLVGENGPELVKMAPGSQVYPAGRTADILAANGSNGQGTVININTLNLPGVKDGAEVVEALQKYGKRNGGIVIPGGVRSA